MNNCLFCIYFKCQRNTIKYFCVKNFFFSLTIVVVRFVLCCCRDIFIFEGALFKITEIVLVPYSDTIPYSN